MSTKIVFNEDYLFYGLKMQYFMNHFKLYSTIANIIDNCVLEKLPKNRLKNCLKTD